jgi:hypothetical protein
MLKYFKVAPVKATEVTVEITTTEKSYIVTCKGATELGKVVEWAISQGHLFQLKNGLDMAWVHQVRTNINNGYSYNLTQNDKVKYYADQLWAELFGAEEAA